MEKKRIPFGQNSILALIMVIALFVFSGFSFDFYYDLNDDVMIKDILSGAYTGTPDAHSIQMLYPVSLIMSLCYRLIPILPWQGLFLCACHGVCFYLIADRSLSFVEKTWKKVVLLVVEAVVVMTLFLWELVIVQYTITSALLAAVACFLVITLDIGNGCSWRAFLRQQIVPVLLVVLAFNIRSEMLFLMSPFIAFSGIFKWAEEKKVFAVETIKKYLGLIGIILFGMGVSLLADFIAYSGRDWRAFRDFFDARTKVYDYTWYPAYEEAEEFYRSIGVTPAKIALIDNYNFGLDESIDAKMLWDIADYAENINVKEPLLNRMKNALVEYKWRTLHEQDAPYNFFVLMSYGMVAALALVFKDKSIVWKIPALILLRTIPWMYVILANRVPPRISHPLYYIEFVILCAWILFYCKKNKNVDLSDPKEVKVWKGRSRSLMLCVVLIGAHALIQLPGMWQMAEAEIARRESVNEIMVEFDVYAKSHPENYYYMDVYSTVAFSEKMFEDVNNSQKNYDLLGGWVSGSPLQKLTSVNYYKDMLSRAELLLLDNFYFVIEEGRDISFLGDFYRTLGIEIEVEVIDTVAGQGSEFAIYRIYSKGTIH